MLLLLHIRSLLGLLRLQGDGRARGRIIAIYITAHNTSLVYLPPLLGLLRFEGYSRAPGRIIIITVLLVTTTNVSTRIIAIYNTYNAATSPYSFPAGTPTTSRRRSRTR